MKTLLIIINCLVWALLSHAQTVGYIQWHPLYGHLNTNNEITTAFETFNEAHNWMESPFKTNHFKLNFRLIDFSTGRIYNNWRIELGWNTHRYFFEAYNLDPNPNASTTHQYVRMKLPSAYLGTGLFLFDRVISPGINLEIGTLHLNTIQQLRSTRFNKKNQDFRNAEVEGVKTFYPRLNLHVQIRLGDDLHEKAGGYLLIEPFVLLGLKKIDFAPFNHALNGGLYTEKLEWKPFFLGIKVGFGIFY